LLTGMIADAGEKAADLTASGKAGEDAANKAPAEPLSRDQAGPDGVSIVGSYNVRRHDDNPVAADAAIPPEVMDCLVSATRPGLDIP